MENQNETNGMAVAGLVLGIVSIVFCWLTFVGVITGIVGLVLSILGRKKCAPGQTGMVTAGLVLSIIGIVISGAWTTCALCTYCGTYCAAKDVVNTYGSLYYY